MSPNFAITKFPDGRSGANTPRSPLPIAATLMHSTIGLKAYGLKAYDSTHDTHPMPKCLLKERCKGSSQIFSFSFYKRCLALKIAKADFKVNPGL